MIKCIIFNVCQDLNKEYNLIKQLIDKGFFLIIVDNDYSININDVFVCAKAEVKKILSNKKYLLDEVVIIEDEVTVKDSLADEISAIPFLIAKTYEKNDKIAVKNINKILEFIEIINYKSLYELMKFTKVEDITSNILKKYLKIIKEMKQKKEVYIFGAKTLGLKLLNYCENQQIKVKAFIDNDKKKIGTTLNNYPIISLEDIENPINSIILVATILYADEIIEQLKKSNIKKIIPYPVLTVYDKDKYKPQFTAEGLQEDILFNKYKYISLFLLLEDEQSKKVLNNIVGYRLTLDTIYMREIYQKNKIYFDKDIITINKDEVFIDGGSYVGDTAMDFLEVSNNMYKKMYLFEPDKKLLQKAKDNLKGYNNIIYYEKGLYSDNTCLKFDLTGSVDGTINELGNEIVEVVVVDLIIPEKITLLKLDIEGAEVAAINGAENQIKNNKPKICVSVYHNSYDIWKIPELIKSYRADYKFYLRHYTRNIADTVLYCI